MAEVPQFSRTGVVAPMGTLLGELKTKVDHETEIAFRRLCHEAGTDVAGALRSWIYLQVHGKTYDEIVFEAMQRRSSILFGQGKLHALQVRGEVGAGKGPVGGANGGSPTGGGEHQ